MTLKVKELTSSTNFLRLHLCLGSWHCHHWLESHWDRWGNLHPGQNQPSWTLRDHSLANQQRPLTKASHLPSPQIKYACDESGQSFSNLLVKVMPACASAAVTPPPISVLQVECYFVTWCETIKTSNLLPKLMPALTSCEKPAACQCTNIELKTVFF